MLILQNKKYLLRKIGKRMSYATHDRINICVAATTVSADEEVVPDNNVTPTEAQLQQLTPTTAAPTRNTSSNPVTDAV